MSWINDNKFLVALGGGTLVGAALILWFGLGGAGRYETAKTEFDAAVEEAMRFERLPLYPIPENRDGKRKALDEYRKAAESLQTAFAPFRTEPVKNVSPQDFTNRLKEVNDEIRKACGESGTTVPDPFFCGFENYKSGLARGEATGILGYQLEGIRKITLVVAKAGATELKNLYRPQLAEEKGVEFKPADSAVARELPLEITFAGPEKVIRAALSDLLKLEGHYVVIRSLSVANSKQDPPRATDAKFDPLTPEGEAGSALPPGNALVLPEEPSADETTPPAATPPGAATPPAAPDTSRILAQVLGDEEVHVCLRLDLMQFLPAKTLP